MSHTKGSSRKYVGKGFVQRLAKQLQAEMKTTYAKAVLHAKALLMPPAAP